MLEVPFVLWSMAMVWAMHADGTRNVEEARRCAELMRPRNALVERVVQALRHRDDVRLWKTFVSEVGSPGDRRFLVHFGPKDRELQSIDRSLRPAFSTMAFQMHGLQKDPDLTNVRIIRRDELGIVVRMQWEGPVRFPNPTSEIVDRLAMAETDVRLDSEARLAFRQQLYQPGGPRFDGTVRVTMDVRLNTDASGIEYAEAVIVDAKMKNANGWFTIGSGTDR